MPRPFFVHINSSQSVHKTIHKYQRQIRLYLLTSKFMFMVMNPLLYDSRCFISETANGFLLLAFRTMFINHNKHQ